MTEKHICEERYCLQRNHTIDEHCTLPPHAVWCDGGCPPNIEELCTSETTYGEPEDEAGFFQTRTECVWDTATYVDGRFNVYDVAQMDALIAHLSERREWLEKEAAYRA